MFKQITRIIQNQVQRHTHQQLCQNKLAVHNLKNMHRSKLCTSSFRNAKLFMDMENQFAYDVLRQTPPVTLFKTEVEVNTDFDKFLDRDWRSAPTSEVTQAFQTALNYCKPNNIDLADQRFDKLVDGLLEKVEHLTMAELATLLNCIAQFPQTESFKSHNFHDIWSALDDICCWKIQEWDVDTLFTFADLWYKLNLGRICDYIYEVLEKLSRKPERLTKDQLVHAFFLMNVCRKRHIEFEYEDALEKKINEMSVDEMAIAAMGFFKTETKIKLQPILLCMMDRVKEECDTIHDISLTAILKIVRFSSPIHLTEQIFELMECLSPQIPRLSNFSCLHIALLGTTTLICHEKSLSLVAQKLVDNMGTVDTIRLKDIERLLLALTMFNFDPKTQPDIFELFRKQLLSPERLPERVKYPKCVCSALSYFIMKDIYIPELASEMLDSYFIEEVFGKSSKQLPRELFLIDRTIEINCPEYKGNRLDHTKLYKAAKWLTDFAPVPNKGQSKRISSVNMLLLDVVNTVHSITGDKNYSHLEHVLPHFPKPDIILCRDKKTKQFVEPKGFENYILGDIMRPSNVEDFTWYAVFVVGWNMTLRNNFRPLGATAMKERQLRKIGYEPILVFWNEFQKLGTEEKVDYILNRLKCL